MNQNAGSLSENAHLADNPIRFKVLVVDQPGPHLDDLMAVLGEVGYNVDAASDSEATYRKLRSSVRPVDLLIIDPESLPGVDGLRFLKVLKKDECCTDTQLIVTIRGLLDERFVDVRGELAIRASFNKVRPLEELLCLVTAILPPQGHNLRTSRRFPVKFLVHYAVGTNRQVFYASNLGLGGIFVCNSQPDPVGTLAQLAFTLPGNTVPLKAEAKVVRVVQHVSEVEPLHYQTFPPGNGLVFVEMRAEHRGLLKEFCDQEETRIFRMPAMLTNGPMAEKQVR
ncbi:MAG: PilZ domain-containing protein [Acidobacteria bacterium]|nr:PilZ domain-containing protein [Acidobacteriota bacterium]MCI0719021.1 PilZ domain-containing protein [Acidobacteriota bacterium]